MRSRTGTIAGVVHVVKFTHYSQIPGDFSTGETFCETMFAYLTGFGYQGRLPATGLYTNEVATCLACLGRECTSAV